jgi:hypothetical protein
MILGHESCYGQIEELCGRNYPPGGAQRNILLLPVTDPAIFRAAATASSAEQKKGAVITDCALVKRQFLNNQACFER